MVYSWTDRNDEEADIALGVMERLIDKVGMQLVLEALIQQNNTAIAGAQVFGADSDYLEILETNLETALKEYKGRHDEFGKA